VRIVTIFVTMDNGSKIGFKDLPCYEVNPFIADMQTRLIPRKIKVKHNERFHNMETGEVRDILTETGQIIYEWKDPTPFVKIFNDQDNYKDMANLSKGANYLFWLINSKLKPNADVVRLLLAEYMEYADTSNRGQFYTSIVELAIKRFIVKIGSDTFYINPIKFFNGRRDVLASDPMDAYIKQHKNK